MQVESVNIYLAFFPGDTGKNLMEWIRFLIGKDMQFPHIKVIIPTAPAQPYTPLEGQVIWNANLNAYKTVLTWIPFSFNWWHTHKKVLLYVTRPFEPSSAFFPYTFTRLKKKCFHWEKNVCFSAVECLVWSNGNHKTSCRMSSFNGCSLWINQWNYSVGK